jgi:hypothetical protein
MILAALILSQCMCIEHSAAKTPCAGGRTESTAEAKARREIQQRINLTIEADKAKDLAAATRFDTSDYRVKKLDGSIQTLEQARAGIQANYDHIQRVSDRTKIAIDCLTLSGDEATVFINQHFVRTVLLDDDPTPHEVVSNITHKETWIRTRDGWMRKFIEELERGPVYLDGTLRAPSR